MVVIHTVTTENGFIFALLNHCDLDFKITILHHSHIQCMENTEAKFPLGHFEQTDQPKEKYTSKADSKVTMFVSFAPTPHCDYTSQV